MKRLDDELVLCLHCRRVKQPGELGWEQFDIAAAELHLCPLHAPAFALGLDWSDRRQRIESTHAASRATEEKKTEQREGVPEQRRRRAEARLKRVFTWDMTPQQVFDELSRWVAGQDAAKRVLATAVRTHYRRVQMRMIEEKGKAAPVKADLLPKESVLLLGPTGSGKSFTCRTLARGILDVPYHQQSTANFSEVGYVGGDVSDMLSAAVSAADGYLPLATKAVLMIDEVDKAAKKDVHGSRDVSGEGVQIQLLELLDVGSKVWVCPFVSGRRNPNQPLVEFDTTDTMFILGGAFVGLSDIIGRRIGGRRRMGFAPRGHDTPQDVQSREAAALHECLPEDLIAFGLIPELVGRLGSYAVFDPLSVGDLRHVMTEVEEAVVKQHHARAQLEGFDLEFAEDAVDAICRRAYDSGMGARRLRSLTSEVVARIFFDIPQARGQGRPPRVVITAATVEDPAAYEVVRPRRTASRQRATSPDAAETTNETVGGNA